MNLLYLDTETTGLSEKAEIIQIAGIIEIDGVVKDEFIYNVQCVDYDCIEQGALDIHKITVEQIRGFKTPISVLDELNLRLEFYSMEPYIIVGQNPKFDYDMLSKFWKRHMATDGRPFKKVISYRYLDLINIAGLFHMAGIFNFVDFKLGTIVNTLGLSFKGNAHNALADIKVTYEAWQYFIRYLQNINPNLTPENIVSKIPVNQV